MARTILDEGLEFRVESIEHQRARSQRPRWARLRWQRVWRTLLRASAVIARSESGSCVVIAASIARHVAIVRSAARS